MLQALGRGRVAAVGDVHLAVGVSVLLELQHDALQCAVLAARFADHVQLTGLTGLPDDPDAQHPRHCRHSGLHAAIAGQVGQRFQREEQMGVLMVAQHLFTDGVELLAGSQLIPQMLRQQDLLRAGGQAVQHKDPLAGILLLVFLRRQLGRIAAARQRTGDGDGVHLIGSLVSSQPVADVGAGSRGLSFIGAQGRGHAHRIQRTVIVVFLVIGDDLQGHTGKIHAIQCIQACGRIHNDPGLHKQYLHSSGKIRRIFHVVEAMISVFQKPVNRFREIFKKFS